MNQQVRIIALLKQEVGSVAINLSAAALRQPGFEFNSIGNFDLTHALQGLGREYQLCRIGSIEDCLTTLGQKPEWRTAAFVLIDPATVQACRPAGQDDEEPLDGLMRLRSEHCSAESGRFIIGVFARDDEAVGLINAGCHEAWSLDDLAKSINSQLAEQCR